MLRHTSNKFSAAVRKVTGFYQARGRDPETEQAWLRVAIAGLALGWCGYLVYAEGGLTRGLVLAIVAASAAIIVGLGMLLTLARSRAHAIALRYLGIFIDMSAISVGMAGADEGGVPMIGVYLWVTVGNGFRFGPRYLMVAYWLQMLGFGLQLLFVPFWVAHRAIGLGLLLALAIVPLYVLVLLSRLTAQKDAAEQLSNAKSRFVANVSHELRTPLTGVFAVYELLRAKATSPDDRELVQLLGNAVTTLRSSVDAVLQMSKLEAGAERADSRIFNIWQLLHQVEYLARPQADAKGLAWTLAIDAGLPPIGYGDPDHLSHVLGNLVNNALKFTHRGGVTLRAFMRQSVVRFEVVDTGIGIPKEQQEHLFERFVQVDSSATRRYGGTGLGTSIARDLTELMGGRIGVDSTPGEGSVFWIELSLAVPAGSNSMTNLGSRRGIKLIVDAHASEDRASNLAALISSIGLHCDVVRVGAMVQVGDSTKALAALIQMPAANAADYVEFGNFVQPLGSCPWLVLAPEYSEEQKARLVKLGAAQLLPDPVTETDLRISLAALANGPELLTGTDCEQAGQASIRSLTILLADDNPSNQILLSRILRDAGHAVRTVERGEDAYALMATSQFDLAILDLNMPDMSGPDVVKLFRAASVGAERLPILILSADATPAARLESLESGADDFLTKPVTSQALLFAVERLVEESPDKALSAEAQDTLPTRALPGQHALVDPERIRALRSIARGDQAFLDRYIAAAFQEIAAAIEDIGTAARRGEVRLVRDALHIIEGTGASIGGVALVQKCAELREQLPELPDGGSSEVLVNFAQILARTKGAVVASMNESDHREVEKRAVQ